LYYIDGATGPRQTVFERRIKQSGIRKTVIDVYYNNHLIKPNISVADGDIRVDRNAAVRRTGSITVVDDSLIGSVAQETLSPYGTEVKIRHGLVYPDGTEELIPMGVFIIDTISWDEESAMLHGGQAFKLDLIDRAMVMNRADIGPTLSFTGWYMTAVINHLMEYFWPELNITYGAGVGDWRNPGGTAFSSGNHWDIVMKMAKNMGGEIYFDVEGDPVVLLDPVFDESTSNQDAIWTVSGASVDDGTMISGSRGITREGVYNSVYVIGQSATNGPPPTAHVFNVNPNSKTNRNGPFRKMGKRIEDSTLTNAWKCQQLASKTLYELTRLSRSASFSCVPNPLLEVGDIVLLEYPSGDKEPALLESFSFPLGGGAMSGTCSVAKL
jgi:hypothetical protein